MKFRPELEKRGSSDEKAPGMLYIVKREIASAISTVRVLLLVNLILVPHYSIALTASGKDRRWTCVEHHRQDALERLDVSA